MKQSKKIKQIISLSLVILIAVSCSSKLQNKNNSNSVDKNSVVHFEAADDNFKIDLPIHKETLKNGLRVIIVQDKRLPIVAYATFFDIGGRHEGKGTTGASHFLEHLMFKGAKKYGPGKFDSIIEGMGGSTNAYTTFDNTVYYQSFPAKNLPMIIDLEADRMQNLLLEPVAFESERQVVKEERKFRYENSPQGKLYLSMMKAIFEKSPYGGSVIGELEDLNTLNRDHVFKYFKSYYAPNNAVLIIVGDLDISDTMKSVKEKYAPILYSASVEKLKLEKEKEELYVAHPRFQREIALNGNNENTLFMLAYPGGPLGTHKAFVMDILSSIIGDGESSYLHRKFVMGEKPILSEVGASNSNLKYNGLFFISGQMLTGASDKTIKQKLLTSLRNSCSGKNSALTERSLQKTKNQYLVNYYQDIQTNFGLAVFLGMRENFFNDYRFYEKELATYQSITLAEVVSECKELFNSNNWIFLKINNKIKKDTF